LDFFIAHNESINTLSLCKLFYHCRLYPLFSIYDTLNIEQNTQLPLYGWEFLFTVEYELFYNNKYCGAGISD